MEVNMETLNERRAYNKNNIFYNKSDNQEAH